MSGLVERFLVMLGGVLLIVGTIHFCTRPVRPPGGASGRAGAGVAEEAASAAPVTEADVALVVRRTAASLVQSNPYAPYWEGVAGAAVTLLPQNVTMPAVTNAAVPLAQLSALTDGSNIAWRVVWADPAPDGNVDTSRFTDAVALQFPLSEAAGYTMGQEGEAVQILHWKALWQQDVDVGFQDVQDLHPNYWSDLYWFAEGAFPFPIPEAFTDPRALQWFIAQQAGNPMAVFSRSQPVEELIAEGFGTLTHQPDSATTAKGAWKDGQWAVVFTRPLQTDDARDHQFTTGAAGTVALAVWEGGAGQAGGRKQYSTWTRFLIVL